MYGPVRDELPDALEQMRARRASTSPSSSITTPQAAHVGVAAAGEVLNLCANNYLGLADHPDVLAAAHEALDRWGYGMAIGALHLRHAGSPQRARATRSREFLGTEDTILFSSCFDANGGLFEALLDEGGRGHLRRAQPRLDHRRHPAVQGAAATLRATATWPTSRRSCERRPDARYRLIATDGVFSMDGYLAPLDRDLRPRRPLRRAGDGRRLARRRLRRRDGPGHARAARRGGPGRHRHRHARQGARRRQRRLHERPHAEIVELLRQRSRPYLFSNTLAPAIVAASLAVLDLLDQSDAARQLRENTALFRARMTALGFDVLPGDHPIVPVMFGDAALASRMADLLLQRGVYVIAFSYPVVPMARRVSACSCLPLTRRTTSSVPRSPSTKLALS